MVYFIQFTFLMLMRGRRYFENPLLLHKKIFIGIGKRNYIEITSVNRAQKALDILPG